MKIIDSIKISVFALTTMMLMANADAEQTLLTGGGWTLSSDCESMYKCSTIKSSGGGELARIDFPYAPVSARETRGVIEVLYSCGTECSATYFILSNNSISGPYSLVDSIDYEKGTLLSVGKRDFKLYRFLPPTKSAIKVVNVDIPKNTTLPSRVIGSRLVNHVYLVRVKGKNDKIENIRIDQ
ncbi:hypothetical protein [Pseudomonas sp. PDM20]|uniref:hypothetical protein n=1 Tax=Pseudomonas sp. PDM20 TaxID=2769254 RepID=UPI0017819570|nr:hypothetical protein [Pseudomonas sp. PDM20]MBD9684755.1 hypothetical protein [Pseudomonas sp. PDM20]